MFETSLIDVQWPRRPRRILAASGCLLFAIFATVASAAYWHIDPVAEPVEKRGCILTDLPAPQPAVVSDQPYRLTSGAITRPVLIRKVDPLYPERMRHAEISGTVVLETVIDESGRVVDAKVVKGLGFGLEQSAIDAVLQWRFEPARWKGRAVKVFFPLTVRFSRH